MTILNETFDAACRMEFDISGGIKAITPQFCKVAEPSLQAEADLSNAPKPA